jgi:hypothetical protein
MAKPKAPKEGDVRTDMSALTLPVEDIEKVSDKYAPEGYDSPEEYLSDLRETYELDLAADDDNRKAALEDKKFVAGEQWDPQVLQQRAGLPCLTINSIPQFTAQLVGDWRENKIAVKVLPSENGDKDVAAIRGDLIRSIETKNRADRVYDNAFESMVQCGDGAFRVGVQYANEDVFDQEITINPIDDCLSVIWDRLSIDPTGRDATHCFVDDLIPLKEFRETWGQDASPSNLSDRDSREMYASGWLETNTVRVTEHWRMIERQRFLGLFEDGSIRAIEENLDELIEKHGNVQKTRISPVPYAQMHIVTGFKILAGPYEWKLSRLPIIRMSGRVVSIGDRRVRHGLVRPMKDVARLRNFWRSVAAEQLGYAPKAQWIATESAVEGREDAMRKAHLSRDPLLVVNDDAIIGTNIQRIDPPPMQMALLNEAQVNTQDMKDVTGIHDASLGIKSNETSGRAIQARQREGDVASLTYYDNGNAAVLEAGDVINQLIGQIYDGTRIIRIVGEDESARLVKINDPMDPASPDLSVGKYDVAITTGASYTTKRVEAAQAMMEAIQVYPELMQVAGDLVVKAQDWPGAQELAERLQKTIPPQFLSDKEKAEMGQQGQDVQAMMQQQAQMGEQLQSAVQELSKLQQENQQLKLNVENESRKLLIDAFKAETDRLEAYANIAKADEETAVARFEAFADKELQAHGLMQGHIRDMGDLALRDKQVDTQAETAQQAAKAKQSSDSKKSTPSAD